MKSKKIKATKNHPSLFFMLYSITKKLRRSDLLFLKQEVGTAEF